MKFVSRIILVVASILTMGCENEPRRDFTTTTTTTQINGTLTEVTIEFPLDHAYMKQNVGYQGTLTVRSRSNLDEVIKTLESTLEDLRHIQDKMPIKEDQTTKPPPPIVEPQL